MQGVAGEFEDKAEEDLKLAAKRNGHLMAALESKDDEMKALRAETQRAAAEVAAGGGGNADKDDIFANIPECVGCLQDVTRRGTSTPATRGKTTTVPHAAGCFFCRISAVTEIV